MHSLVCRKQKKKLGHQHTTQQLSYNEKTQIASHVPFKTAVSGKLHLMTF